MNDMWEVRTNAEHETDWRYVLRFQDKNVLLPIKPVVVTEILWRQLTHFDNYSDKHRLILGKQVHGNRGIFFFILVHAA